MMKCILGFNIGNTNTTMGIYRQDETSPVKTYSYPTDRKTDSVKLSVFVKDLLNSFTVYIQDEVITSGIAFSSVVPEVNHAYLEMSVTVFNISSLQIKHDIKLGIRLLYENPEELGTDRITDAVAAHFEYKKDNIVIDLGTAYTFNVIHENGNFDGGLIGPGIGLTIEALASKTSKLMRIEFGKPDKLVATNTADAIKSGFFYGYLSMINGIIAEIEKAYNKKFLVILTGGYSTIISKYFERKHDLDPLLTMKGIKYIYDLNNNTEY